MKKILSIALVCVALFSAQIISASAVQTPFFTGDVDGKNGIDINDVTVIQKYIAGMSVFEGYREYIGPVLADVNNDGSVTVVDATLIQKHLAGYEVKFERFAYASEVPALYNFTSSYDSGMAMAGTPVEFKAVVYHISEKPYSYEFLINGEVVQPYSDSDTLIYTFEEPGTYEITVNTLNRFHLPATYVTQYEVKEAFTSDVPIITGMYLDRFNVDYHAEKVIFTANASFGQAPYQYSFSIDDGELAQDFSENNTYNIAELWEDVEFHHIMYHMLGNHTINVTVKDSLGNEATEKFVFKLESPRM